MPPTHTVTNQPPEFLDRDLYAVDPLLDRALAPTVSEHERHWLHELGGTAGSAEFVRHGFDANRYEPELRTHDRFGNRIDEVEYHPAWHALVRTRSGRVSRRSRTRRTLPIAPIWCGPSGRT